MANQVPPEPEKDRSERWLLSYADFITLLLVFFIILYTLSKQDAAKFQQVADSLSSALKGSPAIIGQSPGTAMIPGYQGLNFKPIKNAQTIEQKKMKEIKKKVEDIAKVEGLQSSVSVTNEERGIVIRIVDQVLFNSGYADLAPQADKILQGIGKILLTNKDQYIRIEGHTDNVPISNDKFVSNWELSAVRATNVLRLFTDKSGINPRLLSAVGYGEYRPIADNNTNTGKAKNRRVEIIILNSKFNSSESKSTN